MYNFIDIRVRKNQNALEGRKDFIFKISTTVKNQEKYIVSRNLREFSQEYIFWLKIAEKKNGTISYLPKKVPFKVKIDKSQRFEDQYELKLKQFEDLLRKCSRCFQILSCDYFKNFIGVKDKLSKEVISSHIEQLSKLKDRPLVKQNPLIHQDRKIQSINSKITDMKFRTRKNAKVVVRPEKKKKKKKSLKFLFSPSSPSQKKDRVDQQKERKNVEPQKKEKNESTEYVSSVKAKVMRERRVAQKIVMIEKENLFRKILSDSEIEIENWRKRNSDLKLDFERERKKRKKLEDHLIAMKKLLEACEKEKNENEMKMKKETEGSESKKRISDLNKEVYKLKKENSEIKLQQEKEKMNDLKKKVELFEKEKIHLGGGRSEREMKKPKETGERKLEDEKKKLKPKGEADQESKKRILDLKKEVDQLKQENGEIKFRNNKEKEKMNVEMNELKKNVELLKKEKKGFLDEKIRMNGGLSELEDENFDLNMKIEVMKSLFEKEIGKLKIVLRDLEKENLRLKNLSKN